MGNRLLYKMRRQRYYSDHGSEIYKEYDGDEKGYIKFDEEGNPISKPINRYVQIQSYKDDASIISLVTRLNSGDAEINARVAKAEFKDWDGNLDDVDNTVAKGMDLMELNEQRKLLKKAGLKMVRDEQGNLTLDLSEKNQKKFAEYVEKLKAQQKKDDEKVVEPQGEKKDE